jgi:hypothetical protein
MVFKCFRIPMGASFEYAEEVHPTGFVGSDAASRRAAARDAEGRGAGADVGGGSDTSRSVCIDGVLVSGFTGAYDDVALLLVKQPRPFFLPLFTRVRGRRVLGTPYAGYRINKNPYAAIPT